MPAYTTARQDGSWAIWPAGDASLAACLENSPGSDHYSDHELKKSDQQLGKAAGQMM
jgi:hypothetical protein